MYAKSLKLIWVGLKKKVFHFFIVLMFLVFNTNWLLKGVTRAMMSMNRQMKLPEIQKIMQEFEKQSEIMDMKEEMMNDVIGKTFIWHPKILNLIKIRSQWRVFCLNWLFLYILNLNIVYLDDAMGDDDEEEESDAIVTQVLDELGLQLTDQLTAVPIAGGSIAAPGGKGKTAVPAGAEVDKYIYLSCLFLSLYLFSVGTAGPKMHKYFR